MVLARKTPWIICVLALLSLIILWGYSAFSLPVKTWSDVWRATNATTAVYGVTYGGESLYAVGIVSYGSASSDVMVRKYDLNGEIEWSKTYNFSTYDKGVDAIYYAGRLFIVGWGEGGNGDRNALILCLDENGNEIWSEFWDSGKGDDQGRAIAVYGGYVYVAVQTLTLSGEIEVWVLKYDLNGKMVKFSSGAGEGDLVFDLHTYRDKVYLVGLNNEGPMLMIYDLDLNLEAVKVFTDIGYPIARFDGIVIVEKNGEDYIYMLGGDFGKPFNAYLVKLDSSFKILWVLKIENCYPTELISDNGFLAVTGYEYDEEEKENFVLAKVSPEGELVYRLEWGGDGVDTIYDVVSYRGKLYVAGISDSYTDQFCGVVWCWSTEHALTVNLPSDELSWVVFRGESILGGGRGSGSINLSESVYTVVVDKEVEKDGEKWVFYRWSDGVEGNSREVQLFDNVALTALYRKMYRIEVVSRYGTAIGSDWYEVGSLAVIYVPSTHVMLEDNRIAVFKGWKRENEFISAKPILVVEVNDSATYTAIWEVEKVLGKTYTVSISSPYGVVSGAGVYGEGSIAEMEVFPTIIDYGNGTRRVFKGWLRDGELVSRDSRYSFEVLEDVSLEALWEIQYLVEVYSVYGKVEGGGWYNKGSRAVVSVSPSEVEVNGELLAFEGWYLGERLVSSQPTYGFIVEKPANLTAKWLSRGKAKCRVVLVSEYGFISGDGIYPKGAVAVISVHPTIYKESEKIRYVFAGWFYENGTLASEKPSFRIRVNSDVKLFAGWIPEYRVEVYSGYGEVKGAGWYKAGAETLIEVSPTRVEKDGVEYVFKEWRDEVGRIVSSSPSFIYRVERPARFIAVWEKKEGPSRVDVTTTILLILVVAVIVLFLFERQKAAKTAKRRKKKKRR